MSGALGQRVGEAIGRFLSEGKQDELLASIPPSDVKFAWVGPGGGGVITRESVYLHAPLQRPIAVPLTRITEARVFRGIFPMSNLRYLGVTYQVNGGTSTFRVQVSKSHGRTLLLHLENLAESLKGRLTYSFGFNRLLFGVLVIFVLTFAFVWFAGGGVLAGLVLGGGLAAVLGLPGLFA